MKLLFDKQLHEDILKRFIELADEPTDIVYCDYFNRIVPIVVRLVDKKMFGKYYRDTAIAETSVDIKKSQKNIQIITSEKLNVSIENFPDVNHLTGDPHELNLRVILEKNNQLIRINTSVRTHYSPMLSYSRVVRTAMQIYLIFRNRSLESIRKSAYANDSSGFFQDQTSDRSFFPALYHRWKEKAKELENWALGVGRFVNNHLEPSRLIFPKIPDRIWADPHVVFRDDHYFIFVEEMMNNEEKGYIVCLEFSSDFNFINRHECVRELFHMSYPQIIEYEGELYMIPETSENTSIRFYKCAKFPFKWEFHHEIWNGVRCLDTTFYKNENIWYMITTIENDSFDGLGNTSRLFYSDDLLSDDWQEANGSPFSFSVGNSRSAGPLFDNSGKLMRPVQNGSRRYGYGLNYNEMQSLEKDGAIQYIQGTDLPPEFAKSIHSFCLCNQQAFFDFVHYAPFPKSQFKDLEIIEIDCSF